MPGKSPRRRRRAKHRSMSLGGSALCSGEPGQPAKPTIGSDSTTKVPPASSATRASTRSLASATRSFALRSCSLARTPQILGANLSGAQQGHRPCIRNIGLSWKNFRSGEEPSDSVRRKRVRCIHAHQNRAHRHLCRQHTSTGIQYPGSSGFFASAVNSFAQTHKQSLIPREQQQIAKAEWKCASTYPE